MGEKQFVQLPPSIDVVKEEDMRDVLKLLTLVILFGELDVYNSLGG